MKDMFSSINTLHHSLDTASLRQRLINNNIANVETPGYKTLDVSFKNILASERAKSVKAPEFQGYRTDPRHFVLGKSSNSFSPKIEVQQNTSILNNENNVDIEYEMTKLAENTIWFNSLTQVMNKEFSILRYIISEGRR